MQGRLTGREPHNLRKAISSLCFLSSFIPSGVLERPGCRTISRQRTSGRKNLILNTCPTRAKNQEKNWPLAESVWPSGEANITRPGSNAVKLAGRRQCYLATLFPDLPPSVWGAAGTSPTPGSNEAQWGGSEGWQWAYNLTGKGAKDVDLTKENTQKTNTWKNDHLPLGKCKSKSQWDITIHLPITTAKT